MIPEQALTERLDTFELEKGEMVPEISHTDFGSQFYVVTNGFVGIYQDRGDKVVIRSVAKEGEVILFDHPDLEPKAVVPSTVAKVELPYPVVLQEVAQKIKKDQFAQHILKVNQNYAPARVAVALVDFSLQRGDFGRVQVNQQAIGQRSCLRRERVSNVLKNFRRREIVDVTSGRGRSMIVSLPKLNQVIGAKYA